MNTSRAKIQSSPIGLYATFQQDVVPLRLFLLIMATMGQLSPQTKLLYDFIILAYPIKT